MKVMVKYMKNKFGIILKKEITELFRDKKSLAMMLVIPILIPVLVIGLSALFDMQTNKEVSDYNKIGFNYELSEVEKSSATELGIEVIVNSDEELIKEYEARNLNLYVIKNENNYILNCDEDDTNAPFSLKLVNSLFAAYKEVLQRNYLTDKKINPDEVINLITVNESIRTSENENYFSSYITTYGFLFIIMAITVSATYPATDTTAGEKERGTLETLLTFPIKAKDIIIGKFLSVTLSSFITGVLSLVLLIISLSIAGEMFEIYEGVNLMLSLASIIYSLVVIVAYSFLISGVCIAVASKSSTFKEAQSALTPLNFISFFPSMIAFMIDVSSSRVLSLVPFLNFTLLFEDITAGNIDVINLVLMICSTVIIILVILSIIIKQYKSEKVLFGN